MDLFTSGLGELLQPALEVALTVLLPALLGLAAVWLNKLRENLDREIEQRGLQAVRALAFDLVRAAEQAGLTGQIQDIGEEKKAMVLDILQKEADRLQVDVDVEALSAIIESAVVEVFGFSEPVEEAPVG